MTSKTKTNMLIAKPDPHRIVDDTAGLIDAVGELRRRGLDCGSGSHVTNLAGIRGSIDGYRHRGCGGIVGKLHRQAGDDLFRHYVIDDVVDDVVVPAFAVGYGFTNTPLRPSSGRWRSDRGVLSRTAVREYAHQNLADSGEGFFCFGSQAAVFGGSTFVYRVCVAQADLHFAMKYERRTLPSQSGVDAAGKRTSYLHWQEWCNSRNLVRE
ncbi:hypothetical protein MRX96_000566 [Rhipicephalus microplus]